MSSSKAQRQRILKLNIKDKKLCRLFHCKDLSDKDSLFLNFVYEERQSLHYRYAYVYTGLFAIFARFALFKYTMAKVKNLFTVGIGVVGHLYWSSLITHRFMNLTEPYFQKYQIK